MSETWLTIALVIRELTGLGLTFDSAEDQRVAILKRSNYWDQV